MRRLIGLGIVLQIGIGLALAGGRDFTIMGVHPGMTAGQVAETLEIDKFKRSSSAGFAYPLSENLSWWYVRVRDDSARVFISFPRLYDPNEQIGFRPAHIMVVLGERQAERVVTAAVLDEWGPPLRTITDYARDAGLVRNDTLMSCSYWSESVAETQVKLCRVLDEDANLLVLMLERRRHVSREQVEAMRSLLFSTGAQPSDSD